MRRLLFVIIFISQIIFCQVKNNEDEKRHILIGGTAHIGNGEIIENSTIIIEGEKIIAIGPSDLVIVNKDRGNIIDLKGKHIYPSFILPNTTLGLAEIDAVRATRDEKETGNLNPNVRSQIAYNTESIVSSTVRSNGILIAQVTPRGGLIAGTSSIMKLDGWNWEDATYEKDDGIHLYWPEQHDYDHHGHSHVFTSSDSSEEEEEENEVIQSIGTLNNLFLEAQKYSSLNSKETDLRLQSLKDLFVGKKKLYIHVNGANGIKESVLFAKKNSIKKIVLVGASESWRVTDFITRHNIPIILGRVHSLPNYLDDDIDHVTQKTNGIKLFISNPDNLFTYNMTPKAIYGTNIYNHFFIFFVVLKIAIEPVHLPIINPPQYIDMYGVISESFIIPSFKTLLFNNSPKLLPIVTSTPTYMNIANIPNKSCGYFIAPQPIEFFLDSLFTIINPILIIRNDNIVRYKMIFSDFKERFSF